MYILSCPKALSCLLHACFVVRQILSLVNENVRHGMVFYDVVGQMIDVKMIREPLWLRPAPGLHSLFLLPF